VIDSSSVTVSVGEEGSDVGVQLEIKIMIVENNKCFKFFMINLL
jgi:hypothetical protein